VVGLHIKSGANVLVNTITRDQEAVTEESSTIGDEIIEMIVGTLILIRERMLSTRPIRNSLDLTIQICLLGERICGILKIHEGTTTEIPEFRIVIVTGIPPMKIRVLTTHQTNIIHRANHSTNKTVKWTFFVLCLNAPYVQALVFIIGEFFMVRNIENLQLKLKKNQQIQLAQVGI